MCITLVPTTINLIGPSNVSVGQNLTLQCAVDTVENIMSRVDIVWRRDGIQLEKTNNITGNITSGSVVYSDLHMFGLLATSDNGTVVQCEVVINVVPPVRNTATTVIVVFGKYSSIVVCYFVYMCIHIMCMYIKILSVAKEAVCRTSVLFTGTANSPFSTPHISITTVPISIKCIYFMPSIYATLHTKFEGNRLSSLRDMCS